MGWLPLSQFGQQYRIHGNLTLLLGDEVEWHILHVNILTDRNFQPLLIQPFRIHPVGREDLVLNGISGSTAPNLSPQAHISGKSAQTWTLIPA